MRIPFAYFDSSVLVKAYILESGSATGRRLIRTHQVITSAIATLEILSAFRRNLSAHTIDEKAHASIVKRFERHREKLRYVELTSLVVENAEKYVSRFDIRALDAIHVASAMVIREGSFKDVPLITADLRQKDVAMELGLKVLWVEE